MSIVDVIKYEGDNDTLVWKHPKEDFNTLSQLIVHESQEAILFRDGQALDLFPPGRHTLKTQNIPLLNRIQSLPTGGVSPFHCEVYFINKVMPLNLKWGTSSRIQALDPQFKILLHAGASGGMGVQVADSRKFLVKLIGTQNSFDTKMLVDYFREMIITRTKNYLTTLMNNISFVVINSYLSDMSQALKEILAEEVSEFGVKLINFFVSTIQLDENDYNQIQKALSNASVWNIEGHNWVDDQIAEISKTYAANPGSQNNVGGMMAQMPVAFAFGQMLRNNSKPLMDQVFSQQPKAFQNITQPSESVSPFQQPPQVLRPKTAGNSSTPTPQTTTISDCKFCSACGKKLDADALFCSGCGKKNDVAKTCAFCGHELKADELFCPRCGTKKEE